MAENSIGRIWLESYPESPLKEQFKYYVDDTQQPDDVRKRIEGLRYRDVDPKDIKIIEPCCGSGHILVYCFDLLFRIYLEKGYLDREIPALILQNNLTGLDIDKRASQLASFSLIMKARSYDSSFFRRGVFPRVFEIEDTSSFAFLDLEKDFEDAGFAKETVDTAKYLSETFQNAKVIGSLLKVQPRDYDNFISQLKEKISKAQTVNLFEQDFYSSVLPKLIDVAQIAKILSSKYDVMITNPPYIGIATLEAPAKNYAIKFYPNSKTDMFAMFMETDFVKKNGFLAMINMHSWMFLGSFEKLRASLLQTKEIVTMAHLGARAFETIGGEVVQTTTFVLRNCRYDGNGVYFRLVDSENKEKDFLEANRNSEATE